MNSFFSHIFSPTRYDLIQGQESIHESIEKYAATTTGLGETVTEGNQGLLQRIDEVAALLESRQAELTAGLNDGLIQNIKEAAVLLETRQAEINTGLRDLLYSICDKSEKDKESLLFKLDEQLATVNRILDTVKGYIEDKADYLSRLDGITGILLALNAKEYPLDVRFEREYYKGFPYGPGPENNNFKDDFLNLIRGLDQKSVQTVVLQMRRLRAIMETNDPYISFYNTEERERMRLIAEGLYSNILKLSEDCYLFHPYLLPVDHFEPGVFVDKMMLPELEHPERFADMDIIDAGAFIGDSALILSPYTSRKVYAFEPSPVNYDRLLSTIEMNGLENVVPCPMALGNEHGKIQLSINDSGSASTQFRNGAVNYIDAVEASIVKIDDFVEKRGLRVGLIKADIEGAESLMLKGAEQTIREQRPALLISIYHNANDYFKIKPWLESLELGYKFKIRHSFGGTVLTETVLIAEAR